MPRRRNAPQLYLEPERENKNGSIERAVWTIRYFDEGRGRQARKSTGFGAGEGAEAEKFYATWLVERTTGKAAPKSTADNEVLLAEVLSHYIDVAISVPEGDGRKRLSRPDEVLTYVMDLIGWWGKKTIAEITRENCYAYWKVCKTSGAARNRLEYLRRALNIALEDRLIEHVVKIHLPKKSQPRSDFFERDDIAKMLRACRSQRLYTHNGKKSEKTGKSGTKVIRQLADLDSLAFPKRGESESLGQTGGLRCDRGFRYVKILMEKVSGVCRG
ncbi:hypothetical protein, partial [Rhizobium sp. RAF56]|uniref:hypothetical protein n=1 Tax=Rhizobium sp. RAF56 TaxID=3233062 RepID=UPI003F957E4E